MIQSTFTAAQLNEKASGIIENIKKLKYNLSKLAEVDGPEQKNNSFLGKLVTMAQEKAQLDLIYIYDFFEEQQLFEFKLLFQSLFEIVKANINFLKNRKPGQKLPQINESVNAYCNNCHIVLEKAKINQVKSLVGLTQAIEQPSQQPINPLEYRVPVVKIQKEKEDMFSREQQLHIYNLEVQMTEMLKIVEQDIHSKTSEFLTKNIESFLKKEVSLKQEGLSFKQNEKAVQEIEQFVQTFQQNFVKEISQPIKDAVLKIMVEVEKERKFRSENNFFTQQTQTPFSSQRNQIKTLEQKLFTARAELRGLHEWKQVYDNKYRKFMDQQQQIKRQNACYKHQKAVLEQKIKQSYQNQRETQVRMQLEINQRLKQVIRLEKTNESLKAKLSQRPARRESESSRHSIISIKEKSIDSSHRVSDRSRKSVQRPSVDVNMDLDDAQASIYRFQSLKKNTSVLRVPKQSGIIPKGQKNLEKLREISDSSSQSPKKEQKQKQKTKFKKYSQFNIKIEPKLKQDTNEDPKKKQKTLKLFKVNKKPKPQSKQEDRNNTFNDTLTIPTVPTISQDPRCVREQKQNKFQQCPTLRHVASLKSRFSYRAQKRDSTRPRAQLFSQKSQRNLSPQSIEKVDKMQRLKNFLGQIKQKQHDIPQINETHLALFGGEKHASDYQKNTGIWPHLQVENQLVLDMQNTNFTRQIEFYFKEMEEKRYAQFVEYTSFLVQPATFLQCRRKNNEAGLDIEKISSSSLRQALIKIIRFHKLMHKNCNHLEQFLTTIGFYSKKN